MNLKDLKLNDLVKIGIAITATVLLTLNFSIQSHNTTIINNYVEETNKKLNTIQKSNNETQSNITAVQSDIDRNLVLSKQILNEVN